MFSTGILQHAEAHGDGQGVTDSDADEDANAQFQSAGYLAMQIAPNMPDEISTFERSAPCLIVGAPVLQQPPGTGGFLILMPVYPVLLTMLLPVF